MFHVDFVYLPTLLVANASIPMPTDLILPFVTRAALVKFFSATTCMTIFPSEDRNSIPALTPFL